MQTSKKKPSVVFILVGAILAGYFGYLIGGAWEKGVELNDFINRLNEVCSAPLANYMNENTVKAVAIVGYDYDSWYGYTERKPISIDASTKNNSQTLICGMSGSGKSYLTNQYFARICLHGGDDSVVFFADFKQDDSFIHLRNCPRYYPYDKTIEALEIVYDILQKRQSGADTSRHFITLVWDEYMANILSLLGTEKKKAEAVMHKVSEILMLGRSLAVRLVIACQRPDASAFPTGSRLNFGVIIIVGATIESIYSMLMPKELIEQIGDRKFKTGEGVMLWQGSELHFIKVPVIRNEDKMKQICIDALTR